MSTHTSITTPVEDNTACTSDNFSNQYSDQHSATPCHACIPSVMQDLQHASAHRLGSANVHLAGSLRFSKLCTMASICCFRDIANLPRVSGVSGIHRLLTLPDVQSHMVLWQHVVATTEGLAGLKHNQSTVRARCVLPIQMAACSIADCIN